MKVGFVLHRDLHGALCFRDVGQRCEVRAAEPGFGMAGVGWGRCPATGPELVFEFVRVVVDLEIALHAHALGHASNNRAVVGAPVQLRLFEAEMLLAGGDKRKFSPKGWTRAPPFLPASG